MIYIVVALPAEARPLTARYGLGNRLDGTAFPVYHNTDMALTVSGPGKVAAAAATACLGNHGPATETAAWLNIGIAGHASRPIGSAVIANRITDNATGTSWYPPQLLGQVSPGAGLRTVDVPEDDYPDDTLYDMEASGFYPAACRFSTAELVQCFKVVSDNRQTPGSRVTAGLCERLVSARLDSIDRLVRGLTDMARSYNAWHAPHPELERLSGSRHFTVSQYHQLRELVRRWTALAPGQPLWNDELQDSRNAAEVLQILALRVTAFTP
ncbi:MAG: hypothetical protein PVJ66_00010 [Gammaproteobacteria bacterium]|jgi:hypothetical protein